MNLDKELERRNVIIKYIKRTDYSLKPTKEIYNRIKKKIVSLSGIELDITDKSYTDVCVACGLELVEARKLIDSLYTMESIKMVKKYEANLLGISAEAYFIDKAYTEGIELPDIAMLTEEQAISYISQVVCSGNFAGVFNFLGRNTINLGDIIKEMPLNFYNKDNIRAAFRQGTPVGLKALVKFTDEENKQRASDCQVNYIADFFKEFFKQNRSYTIGELLTNIYNTHKKENNIKDKFECKIYTDGKDISYIFPF